MLLKTHCIYKFYNELPDFMYDRTTRNAKLQVDIANMMTNMASNIVTSMMQ